MNSKICLTLTGSSIKEDLEIISQNKSEIDMVELRADFLASDDLNHICDFLNSCDFPAILTVRRVRDGGKYDKSEGERVELFKSIFEQVKKNLMESDKPKAFDFVDFENDFHHSEIEALAGECCARIIRSLHDFEKPVLNIAERVKYMVDGTNEIAKIAFMPSSLKDVTNLFNQAKKITADHILLAMGPFGVPSRILAAKLGNYLTFTSPSSASKNVGNIGHVDPQTLNSIYHFRKINENTKVYGITGFPLAATSSPKLHNEGYEKHNMDAVYIPVKSETIEEALEFNEAVNLTGMSVTIPHKEKVLPHLKTVTDEVTKMGACNTIVKKADGWHGFNTDAPGFLKALKEFTKLDSLKGKKVSVIGAGGASCAVVYALYKAGAQVCVFNRTVSKAENLAKKYDFEFASLDENSSDKIKEFSDIIIQTTSKGMGSEEKSNKDNDPIYFYNFSGKETLFDVVYVPEVTPVMKKAKEAGCSVCNGYSMLLYQGYEQFELFTGEKY